MLRTWSCVLHAFDAVQWLCGEGFKLCEGGVVMEGRAKMPLCS